MKYLLPLLLSVPLLGQVTLSQEEMLGIANNIKELQHSDSSKSVQISIYEDLVKEMDNQIKSDSLIIVKKDEPVLYGYLRKGGDGSSIIRRLLSFGDSLEPGIGAVGGNVGNEDVIVIVETRKLGPGHWAHLRTVLPEKLFSY